jgi:putative ABC transport system permease protein
MGTLGGALGLIGIPMPPPPNSNLSYTSAMRLDLAVVATAFVVGLAAAVLASIVPAFRISRFPVVDALRRLN